MILDTGIRSRQSEETEIDADVRRALRFERKVRIAGTDRTKRFRWGTAFYNSAAPLVLDVNTLEVTTSAPELTAARAVALAARLQAHLDHRQVRFTDPGLARRVGRGLTARDWTRRRFLVMVHRIRQPPGPAGGREIDPETYRQAHEAFMRGEPYGDDESVRQLLVVSDMVARRVPTRYFGAGPRSRSVATCTLFSSGAVAQIEDVGTIDKWRGRGYGRGVVAAALAAAYDSGHSFVFLVADADDWPWRLYAGLGFKTVGSYYSFTFGGTVDFSH